MTTGRINQVALLRDARSVQRHTTPFLLEKALRTRTLNARASDQANAHEPQKDSRARSFSDEANPSCCLFPVRKKKGATRSGMNGRTRRARRNQSIDTLHAPALGCSHCNYSWQTTTPEGSCDAASRARARNASTRGRHAVSHQTTRAPRILTKEDGSQSRAFSLERATDWRFTS